ncbi:MAG TPA: DUF72 domain-containing protein [Acidimicrobiales bacterium]|nr:DUF72 domain-containing protein [Acidimicrobiales bacterium]
MPLLIGTSGWQYRSWRETFYPSGMPQARWLEHYADRFQTLEVNNAFYRLPEARTFTDWARRTPDDFLVGVKMSRYLTHVRRLRQPAEPVKLFLSRARHLGAKLGPVLLQLPPTLRADIPALAATLDRFPSAVRVAVELRHESWFTDETAALLADHGTALCWADGPKLRTPLWRTADWGYVRFHEGRATPHPCYGRAALTTWARRLADTWGEDADVFAFFNNDERGCAVRDATVLAAAARRTGLSPTRVPETGEVRVR